MDQQRVTPPLQPPQVDYREQPNPPNVDMDDHHAAVLEGTPIGPPLDETFKWYDGDQNDARFQVPLEPNIPGYSGKRPGVIR